MTSLGDKLAARNRVRTYRLRKAGLLPPLPRCKRCGARCLVDYYLPLCSICHRRIEHNQRQQRRPNALRDTAEAIIQELRREAREARR